MSELCKQFSDDGYDGTGCWKSSGICRHCGKTEFMHRQAMTDPEPDLVGALDDAVYALGRNPTAAGVIGRVHAARSALRAHIEGLKDAADFGQAFAEQLKEFGTIDRFLDAYREAKMEARDLKAALSEAQTKVAILDAGPLTTLAEYKSVRDELASTKAALGKAEAVDDPQFDNTPGAHPAFWRGQDDGVRGACRVIEKALAGDTEGKCQEPIQAVRDKIAALKARVEKAEAELAGLKDAHALCREDIAALKADRDRLAEECGQLGILADVASDITWGGEQGWMKEGFLPKLGPALRKRFNDLYKDRDRLARLVGSINDCLEVHEDHKGCRAEIRAAAEAADEEENK